MPTHVTKGTDGYIPASVLGSNTPASSNWLRGDGAWVTAPAGGPGGGIAASLGGNTAGALALISSGTMLLVGGNNVTLSQNGQSVTVSGPSLTGYLTTAAQSDHTHSQYLTTAALSNHSHNLATTTTNGASIVVATANSAGATLGVPAFLTTAQAPGAYLTTARASNDAVGLATALTANGVAWTVNSAGLSLNVPAFLTTAALSNHSHGNPTLALTNLSGTTASNSAGLTLSLSAAAPGGGGSINVSAGAASANLQTVQFNDSNGVSFGLNGSTVTASHNGLTTAAQSNHSHGNPTLALTNLTGTTASASNGLTISLSAANPGGGAASPQYAAMPNLWPGPMGLITNLTGTAVSNRMLLMPFRVAGTLSCQEIMFYMSRAATGSDNFTIRNGIFSYSNSSRIDLISSSSGAYSFTATASNSGVRIWQAMPGITTLGPGDYVLGLHFSGAATASMNYSIMGYSTSNMHAVGVIHPGTNSNLTHTSHQLVPFFGRVSVTTAEVPASIPVSAVQGLGTNALPVFFWLGTQI